MSPWEVLGIPDGTADETAIRKAYAAKVKEHPPDVDPGGFRRVREAYEFVRAWTRARAEQETLEEPEPVEPTVLAERRAREDEGAPVPPEPPPIVRETRLREAPEDVPEFADVRAAAALARGSERDKVLHAALRTLADRMHKDLRLVPVWSHAVLETVDDPERPRLLISHARYSDLVLDLFEGQGDLAGRIFQIFRAEGSLDRLTELAKAILDRSGEPRCDVGIAIAFLATSVAVVAPELARPLAERAFHGAAWKEEAVPEWLDLDRRLAAGDEAQWASPEARAHLACRVDGTVAEGAMNAEALRLAARLKPPSALRTLLVERDPHFVAAAEARFPRRRQARQETPRRKSVVGLICIVGIIITVLTRTCDEPKPNDDWRRTIEQNRNQDIERWIEEVMKKLPKQPVGTKPGGSR